MRARARSKQGLADRSRIERRIQPEATFSLTAGRGALSGRATGALALPERALLARHAKIVWACQAFAPISLRMRVCVCVTARLDLSSSSSITCA